MYLALPSTAESGALLRSAKHRPAKHRHAEQTEFYKKQ